MSKLSTTEGHCHRHILLLVLTVCSTNVEGDRDLSHGRGYRQEKTDNTLSAAIIVVVAMMPNETLAQLQQYHACKKWNHFKKCCRSAPRYSRTQSSRESVHQLETDRATANATDAEPFCIDGITPVVVDTIDSNVPEKKEPSPLCTSMTSLLK